MGEHGKEECGQSLKETKEARQQGRREAAGWGSQGRKC